MITPTERIRLIASIDKFKRDLAKIGLDESDIADALVRAGNAASSSPSSLMAALDIERERLYAAKNSAV